MIRNLLIVDISCLRNPLVAALLQNFRREGSNGRMPLKPTDIFMNFLCHCRGQDPGVRSGVCDHLFLVQLLYDTQGFIRADLEHLRTVVLQFCQVVEQRRVLVLLFSSNALQDDLAHRLLFQMGYQLLRIRFLFKTVFLVELGRGKPGGTFHCLPLSGKASVL